MHHVGVGPHVGAAQKHRRMFFIQDQLRVLCPVEYIPVAKLCKSVDYDGDNEIQDLRLDRSFSRTRPQAFVHFIMYYAGQYLEPQIGIG